jgi:DNA-dependent RNA polymerase auxiliary subunit epsilon
VCQCRWRQHKHITYECDTRLTHAGSNTTSNTTTNKELSLREIDQRITDLRKEQTHIQDVYKKLAQFLHAKSLIPINDVYIEYLQYFIREEQMKQNTGDYNTETIASLEKMMVDYKNEMEQFKKTLQDQREAGEQIEIISFDEVFALAGSLYHLPINGKKIRAQVNEIKIGQRQSTSEREKFIELPAKAAKSQVMLQLKRIVTSQSQQ